MSDIMKKNNKQFKLTGWHFLTIMLCFFGVIITVNMVFVTSALNAFSGLVVPNSYVASQHYNEKIEQADRQKALGWKLDLLIDLNGVDFILLDKNQAPVEKMLVTLNLRSTNNDDNDVSLLLNEGDAGHYTGKLPTDVTTPQASYFIELDILRDNQLFYHYEETRLIKFDQ